MFADSLSIPWLLAAWALYLPVLARAVLRAPWRDLAERGRLHAFLGACVSLMVLWRIEAGISPGLGFHYLGATVLTLMFGWRLALIALAAVLAGVTAAGDGI
ncbi:MAG: hypothetical protein GWO02_22280, partial [Gammaproteobacteria bacterium]|nr:hypothetical protein [Gammaproteobacteria bacterium]